MKLTIGAITLLAATALFASGCGSPVAGDSAAEGSGKKTTLTLKITKPDYVAMAAQAQEGSARLVNVDAIMAVLFLMPEEAPRNADIVDYPVGNTMLMSGARSVEPMPNSYDANFAINSGVYRWARIVIVGTGKSTRVMGELKKGDAYGSGTWDGVIAAGSSSLAIVCVPMEVESLVPSLGTRVTLTGGETWYLSFAPERGRKYQFLIWNDYYDGSPSRAIAPEETPGNAILVLYGSDGRKYGGGPYYASSGSNSSTLLSDFADDEAPYLVIYADIDPALEMTSTVMAIPQYPADGTEVYGTYDGSLVGNYLCFEVEPDASYKIHAATTGSELAIFANTPSNYVYSSVHDGSVFTTSMLDTKVFLRIRGGGPDYAVSISPIATLDIVIDR